MHVEERKWSMLLKERTMPIELSALRSLDARIDLSTEEKGRLMRLEKGYQGEVMFDLLTEKLQSEVFILNDLCLEFNRSVFQIDTLLISQDTYYLIEVKNFEGDAYYANEGFFSINKTELMNPLDQLKRSKLLLSHLLRSLGYHSNIEGYVIFINPEFTLFQAPIHAPIILPTQINRFMKKLQQKSAKINVHYRKLADQLISQHQILPPRLPDYQYNQLKKGVACPKCHSFITSEVIRKAKCMVCGFEEGIDTVVLRCVEELRLLFPDTMITTNIVYDWCDVIVSKKQIARILKENYNVIGYGKWTYYE
ncbi:nuclease-related domain-containing protein [Bacillus tuaregi]|uniref:nuclease-related domain-containing protein n=1 Tax=Bacillus tuaregi TaxID=1816695 RepID=UPI000A9EE8BD|nr:nuclease-related domain-containing protein [Bacillus tuaregi]